MIAKEIAHSKYVILALITSFLLITTIGFSQNSKHAIVQSTNSLRGSICINGVWNFKPIATDEVSINQVKDWGTIMVPGAWFQNAWWSATPTIKRKGKGKIWETDLSNCSKAWYETKIDIPADWGNGDILLNFSKISTDATIYIDHNKVGTINWPGGEVNIGSYVQAGKRFTLSVFVLSVASAKEVFDLMGTATAQINVRQSNLSSAGIIGDVFLTKRPASVYISDVFVQPSVRKKELTVIVEVKGINTASKLDYLASVINENGEIEKAWTGTSQVIHSAMQTFSVSLPWGNPRLWDIDDPNMYTLKFTVQSAELNDEYQQGFGFREFWVDGKFFFLNNKKINLRPISNTPGNGMTELIDASLNGLAKAGYNFIEIWPQDISERGLLQYNEAFIDRTDKKGILIAAPLPPSTSFIMNTEWQYQWNKPGLKEQWTAIMEPELKRLRNHPSIVMWGYNPNFFGHSDDQNPLVIGMKNWADKDLSFFTNAKAGEDAVAIIKSKDPTRIVFNHHGAYVGDVHTLNNYLNLIPLQERMDWLSNYASFGEMPFMAIEFGTPLENTLLRGRSPFDESIKTEPLFSEYAAMYLGKQAYSTETKEYRQEIKKHFVKDQDYQNWQFNAATNTLPSFQSLQYLFNTSTWRTWRTWGISGGMVPWSDAHGWRRKENAVKIKMPALKSGRKGTYFDEVNADDLHYYDSTFWNVLPSAKALIANNQETLAWIAGNEKSFTEQSHSFREGSLITKQVVLINDSRKNQMYNYSYKVVLNQKVIDTGSSTGNIGIAESLKLPLHFQLPMQAAGLKQDGKIVLSATIGGKTHQDTFSFRSFKNPKRNNLKVYCFDPLHQTATMLQSLGYEVIDWKGEKDIPFLVVGREALSGGFYNPSSLKNFVTDGGRLLIMTQKPEWFEEKIGFRTAKYLPRFTFPVNNFHPILSGLDSVDLCNWNGESTLITAYPDYLNKEVKKGMYGVPYYGWHWGNKGALSSVAIEKPHNSGWKSILECEFDLAYSPLMEMDLGKGKVVLSTLDLEDYYVNEPVAEILTNQLINYISSVQLEERKKAVIYIGDEGGKKLLESLGLDFTNSKILPADAELLVLGKAANISDIEVKNYLLAGGKILVLNQDGSSGLLRVTYTKNEYATGSINIPDWPQTRGLSASDMHWRSTHDAWLISKGCEIGADGFLGKMEVGKGTIIFCQIDPERFKADSLTYFRFTRWRQTHALSNILTNLGASFASDSIFFSNKISDKSINLEGEWKASLVNKLPQTLSVVGGNEDLGISAAAKKMITIDADESAMEKVKVPSTMERYGLNWADANGEAVYRKKIWIDKSLLGNDMLLELGAIDDFDETYFNRELVGKIDKTVEGYWGVKREYTVPAKLLKEGENVIAVRVFDRYGAGGLLGSEEGMQLRIKIPKVSPGFYHPDYRNDFKLGDNPYRYFRW